MAQPMQPPGKQDITGLVLAGGRGSRMGGLDKGLVEFRGRPLVEYALDALRPVAGAILISANRHQDRYAAYGWPVVGDPLPGYPGPLAGLLAGLEACETPLLLALPCDTPFATSELLERLVGALGEARAAVPVRGGRLEPAFCLLRREVREDLAGRLAAGDRRLGAWLASLEPARVACDDHPEWFANMNSLEELEDEQP